MNKDEYKKLIKEAFGLFIDEYFDSIPLVDDINKLTAEVNSLFGSYLSEEGKSYYLMLKIYDKLGVTDHPVLHQPIKVLLEKAEKYFMDESESEEKKEELPQKLEVTFHADPQMLALIKQIPDEGPAPNLKLELVRAFTKIVWDFINNGFGNSWANPLWLLELCGFESGNFSFWYSFGIPLKDDQKVYDSIKNELYDLQKQVLKIIVNHPEYEDIHGVDMWNENTFHLIGNDEVNTYKYYFNPGFTDCLEYMSGINFDILMNALRNHEDILCRYPRDYSYGSSDEDIKECLNCEGCYTEDQMQEYLDFYHSLPSGHAIMG